MELSEIQDLIKFVAKSGVSEVELETKGIKLIVKANPNGKKGKGQQAVDASLIQQLPGVPVQQVQAIQPPVAAAPAPAPAAPAAPAPAEEDDSKYITVKSPMIGTFYRRPSPDKDIFANIGDEVKPGDVLCIIEAMKLFNEIESEVSGKVIKVLVDDQTPIEYDQPLFLIDPS